MFNETPSNFFSSFTRIFDKFEPFSIISLLFLMFGGLPQIVKLVQIDVSYLRFFSSSQLLSDSISYIVFILLIVFIPLNIGFVLSINYYDFVNKHSFTTSKIQHNLIKSILSITAFAIVLYIHPESILLFLAVLMIILGFILISPALITEDYPNILLYISIASIFFLLYHENDFLDFKLNTRKLENFNKIDNLYKAKRLKNEVLYFNDKYIFVEIKKDTLLPNTKQKKTVTSIEILKFDKFFE